MNGRLRFEPGVDICEYNVMFFGFTNASAVFQYFMNDVFREFLDNFVVCYLGDILIYSKNVEEHEIHVR
ncbi:hypothetical protein GCM10010495_82340 [Kitasatospora herbaricolor]|nr:hypothetical protein GCM10010495_82340 [Kitasatospora herbaricolor]